MSTSAEPAAAGGDVRQRLRTLSSDSESIDSRGASEVVRELNADPKNKKTYGRTPDGRGTIATFGPPPALPSARVTQC